jgi:hypothetical protein
MLRQKEGIMSQVKITHPGYPHGGTKTELDGREVRDVTDIRLHFPLDGLPELHLGILVNTPFECEAPIDAHLHLHVPEGCTVLDMTTHVDNGTRLLVIRREASPGSDVGADVPGGGAS